MMRSHRLGELCRQRSWLKAADFQSTSHLLDMLLVQNLLHADQLDDPPGPLVKRRDLRLGIAAKAERDKEPALAVLAGHHGLELVDVGPPHLVHPPRSA